MTKAILLTGFSNWGKTTHIYGLFKRKKFYDGAAYAISGVNTKFTVESHSNDDYNESDFIDTIKDKLKSAPVDGKDLFCAFCPTRQLNNDSRRILEGKPFTSFEEIHVLLLKYKWDFHAELRVAEIKKYLSSVSNVHITVIDADSAHRNDALRKTAREAQILKYLSKLFP